MEYGELLAIARKWEGKEIETVRGARFRVGVYMECPFFVPCSTGVGRSDGRLAAERFLARFNEIGSYKPGDYQEITRNSSYFVALLVAEASSTEDTEN